MNPIKTISYFFFLIFSCYSNAQQIYFSKQFDLFGKADWGHSGLETDDGYIFIGGGANAGNYAIVFIKTDKAGNIIIKKTLGKPFNNYYSGWIGSLINTSDNGYALVGVITPDSTGGRYVLIVKYDNNGDTLWTRIYGDKSFWSGGFQCKETTDKGLIITGISGKKGNNDIWLIKTDSGGMMLWDTLIGGSGNDKGSTINLCKDGGFVISGYTTNFLVGGADMYIVKTDSVGKVEWSRTYGGILGSGPAVAKETSDGGYIIAGSKGIFVMSAWYVQSLAWFIKTDSLGNILWERTYGPPRLGTELYSVHELSDGSFVAAGIRHNRSGTPEGNGWAEGIVIKATAQGDSIWYRVHEENPCDLNDDYILDLRPTNDGGFITAGWIFTYACGQPQAQDMWVMKLDSMGCAFGGCDTVTGIYELSRLSRDESGITLFPNPFNSTATIELSDMELPVSFGVYNILGECVRKPVPVSVHKFIFYRQDLPAGLYFIMATDKHGRTGVGKMVVVDE